MPRRPGPLENLVGRSFGPWTVERLVTDTGDGSRVWEVACRVCGLTDQKTEYRLRGNVARIAAQPPRTTGCFHCRGVKPVAGAPPPKRPPNKPRVRRVYPFENLVGQTLSGWTVTELVTETGGGSRVWRCVCRWCGLTREMKETSLRAAARRAEKYPGRAGGCRNCIRATHVAPGTEVGRLTVLGRVPPKSMKREGMILLVRCVCGWEGKVHVGSLHIKASIDCKTCAARANES